MYRDCACSHVSELQQEVFHVSDVSTETENQFQNFKMLRKSQNSKDAQAVVRQMDQKSPMRPGEFSIGRMYVGR